MVVEQRSAIPNMCHVELASDGLRVGGILKILAAPQCAISKQCGFSMALGVPAQNAQAFLLGLKVAPGSVKFARGSGTLARLSAGTTNEAIFITFGCDVLTAY